MLTDILLIIIGIWLTAPAWYFVLCGVMLFTDLIIFGLKMYRAGSDK